MKTFRKPLVIEKISEIQLSNDSEEKMAEASLLIAEKNGRQELAAQLKRQIINYKSKFLMQSFNENYEIILENANFSNVSSKVFDWYIQHNTKSAIKKFLKVIIKKVKRKIAK